MPFENLARYREWERAHPDRREDRHSRTREERRPSAYQLGHYVAIDGEGAYADEGSTNQRYVLLAASDGAKDEPLWDENGLGTIAIFEWLLSLPEKFGPSLYVGFGLNYDVERWLGAFDKGRMRKLHSARYRNSGVWFGPYQVRWVRGKWVELWRCPLGSHVHRLGCFRKENGAAHVKVEDVLSNFQGLSFEKVVEEWLGADRASSRLHAGKERRARFLVSDRDFMERYNAEENRLLVEVMRRFWAARRDLGIRRPEHYSPAVLSKDFLRRHGAKDCLVSRPPDVDEAERFAYFGGRIECAQVGRAHRPIWSYDINSAYPHVTANLPDLTRGEWVRDRRYRPELRWSLYRVRFDFRKTRRSFYPFPFRDAKGAVYFPPCGTTTVWDPELRAALDSGDFPRGSVEILRAWHFIPADPEARPFAWVEELYDLRREMKSSGNPQRVAIAAVLKLALNAIYGSFAQQVSLDRDKVPTYQHLGYAGFITSATRAALYSLVRAVGEERVVSLATDALYVTEPMRPSVRVYVDSERTNAEDPEVTDAFVACDVRWDEGTPRVVALALRSSSLGDLKEERYLDMVSVQSGVYQLFKEGGTVEAHGRGWGGIQVPFDEIEQAWRERRSKIEYVLKPRFVGSKLAIARGKFGTRFEWEPRPRTIALRDVGKKRLPLPDPARWSEPETPADRLFPTFPYGAGFTPRTESYPTRPKLRDDAREANEESVGFDAEVVPRGETVSERSRPNVEGMARREGERESLGLFEHVPLDPVVHAVREARDERLGRRRSEPIAPPIHSEEIARA
jgi:hypothetical protein